MTTSDQEQVRTCLALLQEAQGLINQAGAALCPVPGFANEWSELGEAYECVKKHWYRVERRRAALLSKPAEQP